MRNDTFEAVVSEAVDAVTSSREVDWARCARLATPTGRRALDNLRAVSRAFAGSRGEALQDASEILPAAGGNAYVGPWVRRALHVVIAIAAVEAAAAMAMLPASWADYWSQHGDVAVFMALLLVGHTATACLLLFAGRGDRRSRLLGVSFLLLASLPTVHMLLAFVLELPPPHMFEGYILNLSAPMRLFFWLGAGPFLFAPLFLWAFARECPHVTRRGRLDDFAGRMVPISAALSCSMLAACVLSLELSRAGYLGAEAFTVFDAALVGVGLSSMTAAVVVALRTRRAPADESRRVLLFCTGYLMYGGLMLAHNIAEALSPGHWVTNYRWTSFFLLIPLMCFPGVVILWFSVLAVRVPSLREVVRTAYRRLLIPGRLLGGMAAVPALALAWLVASRPDRLVSAVIADPVAQSLFASAGVLLLAIVFRERILIRLETWVYPETAGQREVLAAATAELAQSERITVVSRTVTRTVNRCCGSPATLLVKSDTESQTGDFRAPDDKIAPLRGDSAMVHMLETAGGSLRVHPADAASVFTLLPPDEQAWVVETAADAVVAVVGPGAEIIGCLVVGRRFDDQVVRSDDIPFLETLGTAAGLAIARLRLLRTPSARFRDALPGRECPVCGCVTAAGGRPGCACSSEYIDTEVPCLLAGKYRLARRLGTGGTGAVYLARDIRLERDVAIKILGEVSVSRLMGLKPEAWAMATVTHPGLAQIYGIETFRGRSFLVVEFLAGGTLADQLVRGPLPESQAVAIVNVLADALSALHESGYLHGDVKPSNIGFTSKGSPKLLDFGLARETDDASLAGGTLRYLSPEVLSGHPAREADDVWSLCVVLYEMVSGEHPFAANGIDEVADRIARRRLVRPVGAAEHSEAAIALAGSMLTAPRSSRPPRSLSRRWVPTICSVCRRSRAGLPLSASTAACRRGRSS